MRLYPPPEQDWWKLRHLQAMCPRCHEERMVDALEDFRGIQYFCNACSFGWWHKGEDKPYEA